MAARLDYENLFLAVSALSCQGYRLHAANRTLRAIASGAKFPPADVYWDPSATLEIIGVALVLICLARIMFTKHVRSWSVAAFLRAVALLAAFVTV